MRLLPTSQPKTTGASSYHWSASAPGAASHSSTRPSRSGRTTSLRACICCNGPCCSTIFKASSYLICILYDESIHCNHSSLPIALTHSPASPQRKRKHRYSANNSKLLSLSSLTLSLPLPRSLRCFRSRPSSELTRKRLLSLHRVSRAKEKKMKDFYSTMLHLLTSFPSLRSEFRISADFYLNCKNCYSRSCFSCSLFSGSCRSAMKGTLRWKTEPMSSPLKYGCALSRAKLSYSLVHEPSL